jgi:hypothetical protein
MNSQIWSLGPAAIVKIFHWIRDFSQLEIELLFIFL